MKKSKETLITENASLLTQRDHFRNAHYQLEKEIEALKKDILQLKEIFDYAERQCQFFTGRSAALSEILTLIVGSKEK